MAESEAGGKTFDSQLKERILIWARKREIQSALIVVNLLRDMVGESTVMFASKSLNTEIESFAGRNISEKGELKNIFALTAGQNFWGIGTGDIVKPVFKNLNIGKTLWLEKIAKAMFSENAGNVVVT